MKGFLTLARTEMKLFLREPMAAFFTLIFPLMLLILFGSIYGNEPTAFFGGQGSVDVSVPGDIALIIGTAGIMSLTITLSSYRERGILKRFSATPISPFTILGAHLVVLVLMIFLGIFFLVLFARIFFNLQFQGSVVSVLAAVMLSSAGIFSFGFLLAGVINNARTAQITAMAIFYPMIFLTGAGMPSEIFPESIKRIAQFLPLTHAVTLLRGLWIGKPWSMFLFEILYLVIMCAVCTFIASKVFKWEQN